MRNKDKYIALLFALILITASAGEFATGQNIETATDQDGNSYKTINIGSQIWMSENLRTTKYNDGTPIPLVTDRIAWTKQSSPGYCWYNNDTINKAIYGALYNGYAVNTKKLCPVGWHVSTEAEWSALIQAFGGEIVAGGKLKEPGTIHWTEPNSGATDEAGFNALPGGTRFTNGLFFTLKNIGYWWTFTGLNESNGWYMSLSSADITVTRNYIELTNGFSVRCVKD